MKLGELCGDEGVVGEMRGDFEGDWVGVREGREGLRGGEGEED